MPGGRITDEDIQKVRDASDIVAVFSERVPVKQRGRDFWCCCPLHQEKTPSFPSITRNRLRARSTLLCSCGTASVAVRAGMCSHSS